MPPLATMAEFSTGRSGCSWSLQSTCLLILLLPGLIMPSLVLGESRKVPTVSNEVFIRSEDDSVIEPWVVVPAGGSGFIIAGSLGFDGWMARTDAEGKVLWNYRMAPPERSPNPHPVTFNCAAAMGDGSIYLAGNIPSTPSAFPSPVLVRLDANGRVLEERRVAPATRKERTLARFYDCVQWRDGVAVVGTLHNVIKPATGPGELPLVQELYWLIVLNAGGNITQEVQIPIVTQFQAFGVGPLLAVANSMLVFSATDNIKTELVKVGPVGSILARRQLAGSFQFVRPISEDSIQQIWGTAKWPASQSIVLDDALNDVSQVRGDHPKNFLARLVYRTPDQSLVFFGSHVHSVGETYSSGIVVADRLLQTEQDLPLPLNRARLFDRGSIWAAAPAADGFVTARSLVVVGEPASRPAGMPRDFKRGAVMDFVKF
jgi:hypothetical protein